MNRPTGEQRYFFCFLSAGVPLRSTTCLISVAPTGLYVTARNEAVQNWYLLCKEII